MAGGIRTYHYPVMCTHSYRFYVKQVTLFRMPSGKNHRTLHDAQGNPYTIGSMSYETATGSPRKMKIYKRRS